MEADSSVTVATPEAAPKSNDDPVPLPSLLPDDDHGSPLLDQSHDVTLVTKLLDRSFGCNGVCHEKILLWGLAGCGKRHIATEAALQFSRRIGGKILWIEGRSFEFFVRDYRAAYTIVTGKHLPIGPSLVHTLLHMKTVLEQCRNDWLMVIFDLQFYLEDDIELGLNTATMFLPEWSRILVTSSDVRATVGGSVDQDEAMTCGLKFANRGATCLHVTTLDEEKTKRFVAASGLNDHDLEFPAFRHTTCSSIPPLRLALSCASMRLLQISASRLHNLCLQKAKEGSSPLWSGYTPVFADTMSVLWDALNDYNPSASRLLAICSIVDRRCIPLDCIRRFPEFLEQQDRLVAAIDILRLCGLIEVDHKDDMQTINLHLLPYRWVEYKLKQIQDFYEYRYSFHTWVVLLQDYLVGPGNRQQHDESLFRAEKFWPVLGHVSALCHIMPSHLRRLCNFRYMLFLKQVGAFLSKDGLLASLAGHALSLSLQMCKLLRQRLAADRSGLDKQYVSIRQLRAAACLDVSEYRQGENELKEAKLVLNRGPFGAARHQQKIREIGDMQAQLSISQDKWQEAVSILEEAIALPETGADPICLARRHYWMAVCKRALGKSVESLACSHMAMRYWLSVSHEQQWSFPDSTCLHWVERHMFNLLSFQKYKGALLLGRPLLERACELTPVLGQYNSRLTLRVVRCLCALHKVDEAEATMCKLLELAAPERGPDNNTILYVLQALHELGLAMQRHGRTVEAEGIFRFNLRFSTRHDTGSWVGIEMYSPWQAWSQIIICLAEQGKLLEAMESQPGAPDDPERRAMALETFSVYKYLKELYSQAIQAEKEGTGMEFRASLDIAGVRHSLKTAQRLFGGIKRRIEAGRDFESDIDLHQTRRARGSRLLELLNFRLVYLAFVASKDPSPVLVANEYLWANRRQMVLGQFWKPCECRRKRRRSRSVHEIYNYAVTPAPDLLSRPKKLKQRLITDWVRQLPLPQNTLPPGCSATCPCVEANKRGPAETAAWESKLFTWQEAEEKSPRPKKKARYCKMKRNKSPFTGTESFLHELPNTWWWLQAEFDQGDAEDENYILLRATEIPAISITPAEGETYLLPLAKEKQRELKEFFEIDYASDFAQLLSAGPAWRLHEPERLDDILEDDEEG